MKSAQLTAFVDALRKSGLIGAEQVAAIARWADAENADPQAIAKEIVQKGWLTAFQVKMFWKGKGAELFLNQYVLVERLGEGGMGEVYRAHHRRMERDVALKVIRKERLANPEAVRRFHREIRAAAQLAHENVVMAYDADQAGDRHFFAMEFVDGQNLARLVKDKGPLSIKDAAEYTRQAAMGLQHAHEKGMVHRDIKPSNLLLGKGNIVKILDMGLARLQESPTGEIESRITQEGWVIGTPDFLAPEQARNAHNADIRADIYALGGTFYFLLTGSSPYPTGTQTEKLIQHSTAPIPEVNRPDMPPALEQILHRMMAKKPDDRYQSPAEVAYALEPHCGLSSGFTSSLRTAPIPPVLIPQAQPRAQFDTEPSTDSQFRLPPRPLTAKRKPSPNRWNLPIAIAIGLVFAALVGLGVYSVLKQKPSSQIQLDPSLKIALGPNSTLEMTLIKAGSFAMGSPESEEGRHVDEGPVHEVEITQHFYMGTTEITIRQFQSVVGRLSRSVSARIPKDQEFPEDELDYPVTVNNEEIRAFLEKLNKQEKSGRKPGWEFRLPTEAEWEYACRAGGKTRFAYGETLDPGKAIFGDAERKKPEAVGLRQANAWGLFDMHGNVAEWCLDRYDDGFYAASPAKDPIGGGKARVVVRGGAWNTPMLDCRSARRRSEYPEKPSEANVGFRIVMVPTPKE